LKRSLSLLPQVIGSKRQALKGPLFLMLALEKVPFSAAAGDWQQAPGIEWTPFSDAGP
jgi:hypothetical protein